MLAHLKFQGEKILLVALAGIIFLFSCSQIKGNYKEYTGDPILFSQVVHELNTVVMGNNFSPIVASRNYMYASVAAYEVIAAGNPGSTTH